MEQKFNTINLKYVESKKVSIYAKIVAVALVLLLLVTPLNEIFNYNQPDSQWVMCCLCP